jgi:hypothetical protein
MTFSVTKVFFYNSRIGNRQRSYKKVIVWKIMFGMELLMHLIIQNYMGQFVKPVFWLERNALWTTWLGRPPAQRRRY